MWSANQNCCQELVKANKPIETDMPMMVNILSIYIVNNGKYMVIIWLMMVNNNLVGGWPTPLKNDGLRQLGWWHSQYTEKIMFQTTSQMSKTNHFMGICLLHDGKIMNQSQAYLIWLCLRMCKIDQNRWCPKTCHFKGETVRSPGIWGVYYLDSNKPTCRPMLQTVRPEGCQVSCSHRNLYWTLAMYKEANGSPLWDRLNCY